MQNHYRFVLSTLESSLNCPRLCTFYANQLCRSNDECNALVTMNPEAKRRMKCLYQQAVRAFQTNSSVRHVMTIQAIDSTAICTECVCSIGVFRTDRGTGGVEIDREESMRAGLRFGQGSTIILLSLMKTRRGVCDERGSRISTI